MEPTTEILEVVRRVAEVQDRMARRQVALESLFKEIRIELEAARRDREQAGDYGAKIAVLEYQVARQQVTNDRLRGENEQLFKIQHTHGVRQFLFLIPTAVSLALWIVSLVIILAR